MALTLVSPLSSSRCRNWKRRHHQQETPAERQKAPEGPDGREAVREQQSWRHTDDLPTHTHRESEVKFSCVSAELSVLTLLLVRF